MLCFTLRDTERRHLMHLESVLNRARHRFGVRTPSRYRIAGLEPKAGRCAYIPTWVGCEKCIKGDLPSTSLHNTKLPSGSPSSIYPCQYAKGDRHCVPRRRLDEYKPEEATTKPAQQLRDFLEARSIQFVDNLVSTFAHSA